MSTTSRVGRRTSGALVAALPRDTRAALADLSGSQVWAFGALLLAAAVVGRVGAVPLPVLVYLLTLGGLLAAIGASTPRQAR